LERCYYSWPPTFALCAFRRNCECRISANTCCFYSYTPPMPYNPTELPESCKGYHRPSTDLHVKYFSRIYFFIRLIECVKVKIIGVFLHANLPEVDGLSSFMHYVFTQILRYSHAVLNCASMKAHVLHFQTCLDQLTTVWTKLLESRDRCCRKPISR
ncbi:hypothetical protein T11_5421, partial [Trichinella zimbabwensis]